MAVYFGFQFSYPVIYDQLQGFIQEVALKLGHSQDYSRLGKFLEYAEYFWVFLCLTYFKNFRPKNILSGISYYVTFCYIDVMCNLSGISYYVNFCYINVMCKHLLTFNHSHGRLLRVPFFVPCNIWGCI